VERDLQHALEKSGDRLKHPILVVFMVRQSRLCACRGASRVNAVMKPLLDTLEKETSVRGVLVVRSSPQLVVHHDDFDGQVSFLYSGPKQEGSMAKKSMVTLTDDEREQLLALTKGGRVAARQLSWAHILLHADAGPNDEAIAHALHLGTATVERTRKRFVGEGLEAAPAERPRPGGRRKLAGKPEGFLIALACSAPPDERPCWTMHLLADKLVELGSPGVIAGKFTVSVFGRLSSPLPV
jgi:Homeodomain-like domain